MAKSFGRNFDKPFFAEKDVQIVYLAHQALHGFRRVLLFPEVTNKYVKMDNIQNVSLKNMLAEIFGEFFHQSILPCPAPMSTKPVNR